LSARRFFAYCTLAAWILVTPVTIKTALDWVSAETTRQLAVAQTKNTDGIDDREVTAFRTQLIKQLQFSWEAGVWAVLTVIGSALLAEPRHKSAQAHSASVEHSVGQPVAEL
jgi:hypothetical protein